MGLRTRRQKVAFRTGLLGAALVLLTSGAVLLRSSTRPHIPGETMEGLTSTLARGLPADHPQVRFVDATEDAGIRFRHFHGTRSTQLPEDMGSGAAWGDYDNDGWLDLYVVNEAGPLTLTPAETAASPAHNVLYRNNGDGTFTDVTDKTGVGWRGCGQAAAWADYDCDGFLDLFVTSYGENVLFRNDGGMKFTDVTVRSGVGGRPGFWTGASFGDYDRDGYADLYVCGYVQYHYDPRDIESKSRQYVSFVPASLNPSTYKPERNLLFHNERDGTFREVARAAGVDNTAGRSLSASWCDFDGDGWMDLYVANDVSDNALFHNRGDGTFEDISLSAWVADYRGAMGLAVGDWDGDEDMDLFISHWIAQENALYNNLTADRTGGAAPSRGGLRFMDIADQVGLGQIALDYVGWGTAFLDYDNDGRLDLLVANGSTFQREDDPSRLVPMKMLLFWNRGNQDGFFEMGAAGGEVFQREMVARGLAVGDYDNDGDVDAFGVVNGGPALLLRNEGGNAQGWLKVRVEGRADGRASRWSGWGTKLRAVVNGKGLIREIGAGSSYGSQNAVGEEVFGLGRTQLVESLEVVWPGGSSRRWTDLAANQTVVVRPETTGVVISRKRDLHRADQARPASR